MTSARTPDSTTTRGSFWTRLAAREVSIRVIGIPRKATAGLRFGHVARVYCSKEVLSLLAVIILVFGGLPTALVLLLSPAFAWVTLSVGLIPVLVTALTLLLMFLQTAAAELMRRGEKPVWILNFASTFFAAVFAIFGFFVWVDLSHEGTFQALLAENPSVIAPWIFGALIYACIAEVVTMFVLRFVLPPDSDRFRKLGYSVPDKSSLLADSDLSIGSTTFKHASLICVEAQGNYTRVLTTDGDFIERQTFSSVLGTLPEALGLKVHRSRWIAYGGIEKVVPNEQQTGLLVTTINGKTLTVARSRLEQVEKLLRRYQATSGRKIFPKVSE